MPHEIAPRSGAAFALRAGQSLKVIDPRGEQVADLLAYSREDTREVISSGRTLDYASKLYLTTGDSLYSNRSRIMLRIVEDTVGRHDFLLTPCSADTFEEQSTMNIRIGDVSVIWPSPSRPMGSNPTKFQPPSMCS